LLVTTPGKQRGKVIYSRHVTFDERTLGLGKPCDATPSTIASYFEKEKAVEVSNVLPTEVDTSGADPADIELSTEVDTSTVGPAAGDTDAEVDMNDDEAATASPVWRSKPVKRKSSSTALARKSARLSHKRRKNFHTSWLAWTMPGSLKWPEAKKLHEKAFSGVKLKQKALMKMYMRESVKSSIKSNEANAASGLSPIDLNCIPDAQWVDFDDEDDDDANVILDTGWHTTINDLSVTQQALITELAQSTDYKRGDVLPTKIEEAWAGPDGDFWKKATDTEKGSLDENETWGLEPRPKDGSPIMGNKWVFQIKRGADGKILKYKARLVAQGFSQVKGVNYTETYSPVARRQTIMTLVAWANKLKVPIYQLDFTTAYLNGEIDADVYMKQPAGYVDAEHPDWVCHLKKGLYGLKQGGRLWNNKLNDYLLSIGFSRSKADSCMYTRHEGDDITVLSIYVDDVIYFSTAAANRDKIKHQLEEKFKMTDLGQLHWFLVGMEFIQNLSTGITTVNQTKYAENVLRRFGMTDCASRDLPHDPKVKLTKEMSPEPDSAEWKTMQQFKYREAIGCLMYLLITRHDLKYIVIALSRFVSNPGREHWDAIPIARYCTSSDM